MRGHSGTEKSLSAKSRPFDILNVRRLMKIMERIEVQLIVEMINMDRGGMLENFLITFL
jgi:hypothetical protein